MLFENYMTTYNLLILQEFHIKEKKLIGQKLIFILQGIGLLFNKDYSTIIYLGYFSLSYATGGEK